MIVIKYQIHGQTVPRERFAEATEEVFPKVFLDALERIIRNKLTPVYCSSHKQAPVITFKDKTNGKFFYDIEGCCDTLIHQTEKFLV